MISPRFTLPFTAKGLQDFSDCKNRCRLSRMEANLLHSSFGNAAQEDSKINRGWKRDQHLAGIGSNSSVGCAFIGENDNKFFVFTLPAEIPNMLPILD